ncbi:helix-turn-helix domain-containing protein [Kitasatospora sp. DSM 101779]|uniref:IclR family transcriptional regulator domain-containing protein n=1 Tax=Kitasatospora sp. DSM 101779 TaxID=2853165 RepID=UPI003986FDCC
MAPALRLSEISRRAGLSLPTAHRRRSELSGWAALERDTDAVYHVGLRLFELGTLAPRGPVLREAALPFLEDLCQATPENVQLAVREAGHAVDVERLAGRSSAGVRTRLGAHWPLHTTGVGLALRAHAPSRTSTRPPGSPPSRPGPRPIRIGCAKCSQKCAGRERHGFHTLPLLARPDSVSPLAVEDQRPVTAWADGVELRVLAFADGAERTVTVPRTGGLGDAARFHLRATGERLTVTTDSPHSWHVRIGGPDGPLHSRPAGTPEAHLPYPA